MWEVEARFGLCGDSVNLGARYVLDLHRMCHGHENHFWAQPLEQLGEVGQMEACFGPFGDTVNLGARQMHGLR